jgi:hypothetical protein
MKQNVTFNTFIDKFRDMGRGCCEGENFSYTGLQILFDYIEELEESTGEEIELDVIALCCDYEESCYEDVRTAYELDEDASDEEIQEYLENRTSFCGEKSGVIVYQSF